MSQRYLIDPAASQVKEPLTERSGCNHDHDGRPPSSRLFSPSPLAPPLQESSAVLAARLLIGSLPWHAALYFYFGATAKKALWLGCVALGSCGTVRKGARPCCDARVVTVPAAKDRR